MIRFFVRPEQIADGRVTLDADDAHHLRTVLQAKAGDAIAVLDGSGREWPAVLETVGKARAEARLGEPFTPDTEPDTQITVAQALPKMAEKMEQVLQRGTEIGAAHFRAFASERSLTHLTGERHAKRLTRWRSIVKTAAEQAHRAVLPTVRAEGDLGTFWRRREVMTWLCLLTRRPTCRRCARPFPAPHYWGGGAVSYSLSARKAASPTPKSRQARAAGARAVSLGPRILRTETAAMVMAAQIIYELEQTSVR